MERKMSNESIEEMTCRIWYGPGNRSSNNNSEDPGVNLICPCEWRGSIRYVHEACINKWALALSNNSYQSIQNLRCELWNTVFYKRRQWLPLSTILKKLVLNFQSHFNNHAESLIIMAYVFYLGYKGYYDIKTKYKSMRNRASKIISMLVLLIYSAIIYLQIGYVCRREFRRLYRLFMIFRDSWYSYKFWDK